MPQSTSEVPYSDVKLPIHGSPNVIFDDEPFGEIPLLRINQEIKAPL